MDRNRDGRGSRRREEDANELEERLVKINRVAKVVRGGRRFAFGSIVVVGDSNGRVGIGHGKGGEVTDSIRKGVDQAKKSLINVPLRDGHTIPHEVESTYGAARVILKPAAPGTGVIAGGGVRAVVELAGIRDVLTKSVGNNNPVNVTKATMKALQSLQSEQDVIRRRKKNADRLRKPHEHGSEFAAAQAARDRRIEAAKAAQNERSQQKSSRPRRQGQGGNRRGGGGGGQQRSNAS